MIIRKHTSLIHPTDWTPQQRTEKHRRYQPQTHLPSLVSPFGLSSLTLGSLVLLALALVLGTSPSKVLATPTFDSYTIDIAASTRLLDAVETLEYEAVQREESCDNPHARVRARNRPGVRVSNSVNSVGDISSFSIEIKETAYLFGTGDNAYDGFGGEYIRTSPYTDEGVQITGSSVTEDGRRLTIHFDGLAAGKTAIFRVDLDTNDNTIFPFPDFRNILFGANDEEIQRAVTSATFTGDDSTNTPDTPLNEISELTKEYIVYSEGDVRPYSAIDPVIPHGGRGSMVPEPTSAMLLLVSVMGALAIRRAR